MINLNLIILAKGTRSRNEIILNGQRFYLVAFYKLSKFKNNNFRVINGSKSDYTLTLNYTTNFFKKTILIYFMNPILIKVIK